MSEKPILFSGPMVKATLEGQKTQTRRVIQKRVKDGGTWFKSTPTSFQTPDRIANHWPCPFGKRGDYLWVREKWMLHESNPNGLTVSKYAVCDGEQYWRVPTNETLKAMGYPEPSYRQRPSIHMPRWASRITLEITNVRVERVQAICEADALAEGFDADTCAGVFDKAAQGTAAEYCRWIEDDVTGEGDPGCSDYCVPCAIKAAKEAGPNWRVRGWDNAEESDGPAMCDNCGVPLFMSLTSYGIERELRIEDDPNSKKPQYFPVRGGDARIVHTIASGIGNLKDEHLGRLAQIGFATGWDALNAKRGYSWADNPWVWVIEFKKL